MLIMYIIALLGGICVGALGILVAARLRSGQEDAGSAPAIRRRYQEFQKVWVETNLLIWGDDGRPVTGESYRVRATVREVDDDGIFVQWASPVPVAASGVIARRPVVSLYYTWDDLRTRRWWQPLTAWY
ncbi:hypothetical protein EKD04_017810 [Chloroflexales bacterium ZM16-3]|nr:hypothetical protein [Chloroflexales bacterium ZM16-3]